MSDTKIKNNMDYFQKQFDTLGANRNVFMLEFDPKRKEGRLQLVYISKGGVEKLKDTHEYRHSYADIPRFDRVYKSREKMQ